MAKTKTAKKYPYKKMFAFKVPITKTTKIVKKVLQNQEPYKYVVDSLSTSVGQSWTNILNISNIVWSPTEDPKYRNSTKTKIMGLALNLKMEPALGDTTNKIRVALVRGRRSGALNMSNVAYDPNSSGDDVHLQFNQRYVDVIFDRTFNVQEQAAGAVFPPYRSLEKYIKLNKLCKYTETPDPDTTYTTQPYNNTAMYLIACTDSSIVPNPRFSGQSRISFKDID